MAQRDYEEQPEAPDLGATVQLETGESLVGPADGNDAVDAGYSPPDRPYALDDDELTVAGQAAGETLDERLAGEVPEEVPGRTSASTGARRRRRRRRCTSSTSTLTPTSTLTTTSTPARSATPWSRDW